MFSLFEVPPYSADFFKQAGVDINEVDAIIVSHHHRDHDNTVGASLPQEIPLIMPLLTAELSAHRNAAANNTSLEETKFQLNAETIYPGVAALLEKGQQQIMVETLEVLHSVPSSMFIISSSNDGGETWTKEVVYTGDTLGPIGLQKAVKDRIITPEQKEQILQAVRGAKLVVIDCGRRIIHSEPEEVFSHWLPLTGGAKVILVHNTPEGMVSGKEGKNLKAANQAAAMLPEAGSIIQF